jgi:hypothetical protein
MMRTTLARARVAELAIRGGLKILWPRGRVGSTPTPGTARGKQET